MDVSRQASNILRFPYVKSCTSTQDVGTSPSREPPNIAYSSTDPGIPIARPGCMSTICLLSLKYLWFYPSRRTRFIEDWALFLGQANRLNNWAILDSCQSTVRCRAKQLPDTNFIPRISLPGSWFWSQATTDVNVTKAKILPWPCV